MIYAAGSPECRTHVLVPVHMAMVAIIWLQLIKMHYNCVENTCQGQNFACAKAKKPATRRNGGNGGSICPYSGAGFDSRSGTTILRLLHSSVLQVFYKPKEVCRGKLVASQ